MADVTAAFSSVFIALSVALGATYAAVPELRGWLGGRYGLVDLITFGALVAALVVGFWAMRRSTAESRFPRIIPLLASWGILDELRYFTGLVGLSPKGGGAGAIRSLDDVGSVLAAWSGRVGLGWPAPALLLCLLGVGTVAMIAHLRPWSDRLVLVTEYRVICYLLVSMAATIAAPLIGLFGPNSAGTFARSLLELTGATLLAVAGLAAGDHRRTVAGWRRRLWPWLSDEGPLASLQFGDSTSSPR